MLVKLCYARTKDRIESYNSSIYRLRLIWEPVEKFGFLSKSNHFRVQVPGNPATFDLSQSKWRSESRESVVMPWHRTALHALAESSQVLQIYHRISLITMGKSKDKEKDPPSEDMEMQGDGETSTDDKGKYGKAQIQIVLAKKIDMFPHEIMQPCNAVHAVVLGFVC
jgi:hypothetical protein